MKSADPTRLLIVSLNYAPEQTGIGKYVSEMTEWLTARGIQVHVVTAPPYYPAWSIRAGYSGKRYSTESLEGARVYRCPLWVPQNPSGFKRILHLLSFAFSSLPVIFWQAVAWRPHMVFVVEPPLGAAPAAWLAARLCRASSWLHVQDFEVDAAFELGLIRSPTLQRGILALERWLLRRFDHVSSISDSMLSKLQAKGIDEQRIVFFPNWVDTELIRPGASTYRLREELGIPEHVRIALYSGNMGEKQGLEVVIESARLLASDPEILFLLCGDGVARRRVEGLASRLPNVRILPLQPLARLNELLNLADVHLLPQRASAEALVLPSKLTAIMASGRPVIATASLGSDVARAAGCGGIVVQPGDADALAHAIGRLLGDEALRGQLGEAARAHAVQHWEREAVMQKAFARIHTLADVAGSVESGSSLSGATLQPTPAAALIHAQQQVAS